MIPEYFPQYTLNLWKRNTSVKDKSAEFMSSPKCPLFGSYARIRTITSVLDLSQYYFLQNTKNNYNEV